MMHYHLFFLSMTVVLIIIAGVYGILSGSKQISRRRTIARVEKIKAQRATIEQTQLSEPDHQAMLTVAEFLPSTSPLYRDLCDLFTRFKLREDMVFHSLYKYILRKGKRVEGANQHIYRYFVQLCLERGGFSNQRQEAESTKQFQTPRSNTRNGQDLNDQDYGVLACNVLDLFVDSGDAHSKDLKLRAEMGVKVGDKSPAALESYDVVRKELEKDSNWYKKYTSVLFHKILRDEEDIMKLSPPQIKIVEDRAEVRPDDHKAFTILIPLYFHQRKFSECIRHCEFLYGQFPIDIVRGISVFWALSLINSGKISEAETLEGECSGCGAEVKSLDTCFSCQSERTEEMPYCEECNEYFGYSEPLCIECLRTCNAYREKIRPFYIDGMVVPAEEMEIERIAQTLGIGQNCAQVVDDDLRKEFHMHTIASDDHATSHDIFEKILNMAYEETKGLNNEIIKTLARIWVRNGKKDARAIELYETVFSKKLREVGPIRILAETHESKQQWKELEEKSQRLLQFESENMRYGFWLVEAQLKQNETPDFELAKKIYSGHTKDFDSLNLYLTDELTAKNTFDRGECRISHDLLVRGYGTDTLRESLCNSILELEGPKFLNLESKEMLKKNFEAYFRGGGENLGIYKGMLPLLQETDLYISVLKKVHAAEPEHEPYLLELIDYAEKTSNETEKLEYLEKLEAIVLQKMEDGGELN